MDIFGVKQCLQYLDLNKYSRYVLYAPDFFYVEKTWGRILDIIANNDLLYIYSYYVLIEKTKRIVMYQESQSQSESPIDVLSIWHFRCDLK